ncbi:hypothetical protein B6U98_00960 [Thermoplasmatales archaeon ex4572_165]|nr:MAG: hypothetical protein B6U98_00960 [Thermoplasmatales archaeon ex4572_165]RLF58560.1 MAG: hypothetical protein DRN27_05040 [Thermoplasmata archaeon]
MGLLEILTKRNDIQEKKLICQSCQGLLYPLEESIEKLYVCESCGKTFDHNELIDKNLHNNGSKAPIYMLFNDRFMQKYTNFDSFIDFLEDCPIEVENYLGAFDENIVLKNPRKWNRFVKTNTIFTSWNEMFEKAIEIRLHI